MSDKPREWEFVQGHHWSGPDVRHDEKVHVIECSAYEAECARAVKLITALKQAQIDFIEYNLPGSAEDCEMAIAEYENKEVGK